MLIMEATCSRYVDLETLLMMARNTLYADVQQCIHTVNRKISITDASDAIDLQL